MKTLKLTLTGLLLLTLSYSGVKAQTRGNGNVTKEERQLATFDAVKVGCAINLFISQGDVQSVKVETDENLQNRISTKVSNGTLSLDCENVQNATKMNVYVTAVSLSKIDASGAAKVVSETPLKSEVFGLYTSGAAKATLTIETGIFNNETSGAANNTVTLTAKTANTEISGAGNMVLKGTAEKHKTEVSGAGNLKAVELITDNTDAEVSGAGNAKIMARKKLTADLSGAGNITYFDKGDMKKIAKQGEYEITFDGMDNVKSVIIEKDDADDDVSVNLNNGSWNISENGDSVTVILNDKRIVVVTDDSVRVNIGQHDIVIDDDGVKFEKCNKRPKFNGHWAGFGLSVNGLLNEDHIIDYPAGAPYLDINYNKSSGVSLNFFEQNINLINQKLGLVTGLGVTWNNYRFDENVILTTDGKLDGYYATVPGNRYEKSKLMVASLRIPLLLEYQTNSKMKGNSFHVGAGAVGSFRMWSHSKNIINDTKAKSKDDFYINPFIINGMATIGWGVINLYGTYSFSEFFRNGKGPVAYPFEVGITLAGF